MRAARFVVAVVFAGVIVSLLAGPAVAGGNWLDFRRDGGNGSRYDILVPGDLVVARANVWVQGAEQRHGLQDGPFYAWLILGDGYVSETSVPSGAMRIGTFTLHPLTEHVVRARAEFTLPQLDSGPYSISVCNDPCTFSGFGEYVQGWIHVVQTPREAQLLDAKWTRHLRSRDLKRHLNRAVSEAEELRFKLDASRAERDELLARADGLEEQLTSTVRAADNAATVDRTRPLIGVWAGALIAFGLVGVAAALLIRRRRSALIGRQYEIPIEIPDTIEELTTSTPWTSSRPGQS